jgi:hypothetical protein
MKKDGKMTRAKPKNTLSRQQRQEELRELLSQQGHLQHVVDILVKLSDTKVKIDEKMVARYKITVDTKLKLMNKYLSDLKSTEITGDGGGDLVVSVTRKRFDT